MTRQSRVKALERKLSESLERFVLCVARPMADHLMTGASYSDGWLALERGESTEAFWTRLESTLPATSDSVTIVRATYEEAN